MNTTSYRTRRFRGCHSLIAIGLTLGLLSLTVVAASAQQATTAAVDAAMVKPFVSESTFMVLKVDPSRLSLPQLADALEAMSPDSKDSYRQVSQQVSVIIDQMRAMVDDQPLYATAGIPISQKRIPAFAFVKKPSAAKTAQLTAYLKQELGIILAVHGDYVVVTPKADAATALADAPAQVREDLATAFEAVADYPAQVLLLPPPYVWSTVRDLSPELPKQLGGGPSSILTEGIQWAAFGFEPAALRAQLVIQSSTETAARELAERLPKMVQSAYNSVPEINKRVPVGLSLVLLSWLDPQVEGKRVIVNIEGLEKTSANWKLLALLAKAIEERSSRHSNQDRFKQMLLAMHNYYDSHRSFPPADKYRDKDGKHLLSWRVHILPYLEQSKLFEQFHLDEPWDSPHNKTLLEKMPDIYKNRTLDIAAGAIKPGYTTFQTPVGEGTAFGQDKASRFQDFRDGTSNTVILVEVKPERAVPWTAPDDYVLDPKNPGAGLLIGSNGRWLCGIADGSVNQFRRDIPVEILLHLFQIGDGNPINFKEIR